MAVPLSPAALLSNTDAQVLSFLKMAPGDEVTTLINEASAECERYCNRPLKSQDFTNLRLASQERPRLRPRAIPIDLSGLITITLDGVVQTLWKQESQGDPSTFDVMLAADDDVPGEPTIFYRRNGWLGASAYPIRLTYTGGFDPVPEDLQHACKLICQMMQRQAKGATDVSSYGPGPVSQSITYRTTPDSLIPMGARYCLDRYRVVPV